MTFVETPVEPTMKWIQGLREKMYEETKGMTQEEIDAYVRRGSEDFRRKVEEMSLEEAEELLARKRRGITMTREERAEMLSQSAERAHERGRERLRREDKAKK